MARIRSVHPSLFTDEAWVSCSPLARLLYIGLWTDADDQGLFEWKPLQIKMRLLPGDTADVPSLLAELVAVDLIATLEAGGKKLGAIRYFRRFQRPKKPNAVFVLPPEWVNYVGLSHDGSEPDDGDERPVPNQFPTSGEKSPQMEDGGGRVGEEVSEAIASSVADGDDASGFEALWKAYPHVKGRSSRPKALAAWGAVDPAKRCGMAAAAARYAAGGTLPQGGAPALAKWLSDELWRDWIAAGQSARTAVTWCGPAGLRASIVARMGEDWAASWLDPCEWDEEGGALIAPRDFTVRQLEQNVRKQLVEAKVAQVRVKGRAA